MESRTKVPYHHTRFSTRGTGLRGKGEDVQRTWVREHVDVVQRVVSVAVDG